tara:strand:- start:30 stop:332 length:303 start_codon:yes stop_codon:yes gene_type:complete
MFQIEQAIQNLAPGNGFSVLNGTDITWFPDNPDSQPSDSDIKAESERLQAEYDAQEYARNRKIEYDALNQFELLSDDAVNGTTTYKNAITAIKDKYPKPE